MRAGLRVSKGALKGSLARRVLSVKWAYLAGVLRFRPKIAKSPILPHCALYIAFLTYIYYFIFF